MFSPRPLVTYGRSARHPPLVSQSLSCPLGCKSLFLSEKSLPLIFVHSATLGVGRELEAKRVGADGTDREMHTLTSTRIPDYARKL